MRILGTLDPLRIRILVHADFKGNIQLRAECLLGLY